MDIITAIIFIILFLVFMIFVFAIGLLRPFIPKKEMFLVFLAAFIIGSLGGAFFLSPVYNDLPEIIGNIEKALPTSDETLYLDVSYSNNPEKLISELSSQEGVQNIRVTGFTVYMSKLSDIEYNTVTHALKVIDSSYANSTVTKSGKVDVLLKDNASVSKSLQSFSNWYEQVYGIKLSSALVHMEVKISASKEDQIREFLLKHEVVPSNVSGHSEDTFNYISNHKLSDIQFIILCGVFGVLVSLLGVYFDKIIINNKKLKKHKKR